MIYYEKWHLTLFVRNTSFLANVAGCVILLMSFKYWRKIRELKKLKAYLWTCPSYQDRYT
uniref:Uncharacterized protein n=1 Tax=Populus trichocarpa TaxID=3694 RepID=A0A3N7HDH3_POPTR